MATLITLIQLFLLLVSFLLYGRLSIFRSVIHSPNLLIFLDLKSFLILDLRLLLLCKIFKVNLTHLLLHTTLLHIDTTIDVVEI